MSDPVREAANRARIIPGAVYSERVLAETAAREALKPIQELHAIMSREKYRPDTAYGIQLVLQSLAPLIFSTEELEKM